MCVYGGIALGSMPPEMVCLNLVMFAVEYIQITISWQLTADFSVENVR